jgi:hypothetical protein
MIRARPFRTAVDEAGRLARGRGLRLAFAPRPDLGGGVALATLSIEARRIWGAPCLIFGIEIGLGPLWRAAQAVVE